MQDELKQVELFSNGYGIVAKIVMQDRELNITSKAIYSYFCSFSGQGDCCFPSRDKICFDLQISKDTFYKYLKQLIDKRYVVVKQEKDKGKFARNIYILPCMVSPCTELSDTVSSDTVVSDTNNNNNKNNSFNNNTLNKEKNIKKESKSAQPTLEEINEYIREKKLAVDGKKFFDYFTEGDWIDSKGQKVKNWKQKLLTWNSHNQPKIEKSKNFENSGHDISAIEDYINKGYGG